MPQKKKKVVQYVVDSQIKKKFESASGFAGTEKNKAVEEAMQLYIDRFVKGVDKK